jgi:CubicO group peptidase (beta-lactamase class C family)
MAIVIRRAIRPLLLVLFLSLAAAAQTVIPADLDAWVARSMRTFDVPGMSVGIVKDGKLVFAKGYGVRKLGSPEKVDENTLFGIASNTKAFTAAALAILVDEGKISWDDPVIKYLPSFHLYDPYMTQQITIRDLLSHRSGLGLGEGDLMFWPDTDFTREQVLSSARFMKPVSSMRSKYAYNNFAFVVAGQIIPAVTGKPWDDFIRERIFAPLGMKVTTIGSTGFKPTDNVASPHSKGWRLEGQLTPVPATKDQTWAAAAGIKSNIPELSKWLITQLNQGTMPDGKQLFSQKRSEDMWSPTTIVPVREPAVDALKPTKPNFAAYGLGWGLRDYKGRKIVSHTGGLTGMVTLVTLVPDEKLGIIVLTNQEEGGAFNSVLYHILDTAFGLRPADWIAAFKQSRDENVAKDNKEEQDAAAKRAANSKPSLELAKYAGAYEDPWYGRATIEDQGGKLVLHMTRTPAMVADLSHWQYDTFKAIFRDKTIPDAFLTFDLNEKGEIDQVKMVPVSDLADFSFDYQDLLFTPVKEKEHAAGSH